MSNDRSGLPGIWTAVRHLVSVLVGAPGPIQAANAAPDVASEAAPISAQVEESFESMLVTPLVANATRSWCCPAGRLLDRPWNGGARKSRAPKRRPIRRARLVVRLTGTF